MILSILKAKNPSVFFDWLTLNATLQTGLANPMDEAITAQGNPGTDGVRKLAEIPYDFIRKRLTVVVEENGQKRMITKGALDNILAICNRLQLGNENYTT